MVEIHDAIVIGAGPGGLSTTTALLDTGIKSVLWVDRDFKGGRLNTMYREISSLVSPTLPLYLCSFSGSHLRVPRSCPFYI